MSLVGLKPGTPRSYVNHSITDRHGEALVCMCIGVKKKTPFINCVAPVFRGSCFKTAFKVLHRCEKVTRIDLP